MARAVSQEKGKVRVTVAVPTAEEGAQLFGVPVAAKGIQPVWLRLENHDTVPYWLLAALTRIISRPKRWPTYTISASRRRPTSRCLL